MSVQRMLLEDNGSEQIVARYAFVFTPPFRPLRGTSDPR